MKQPLPNPLDWVANLIILLMILYIGKSALGINWNKKCHAEQVMLGICQSPSTNSQPEN